jgi:DNA-binding response OmpR family regulator
VCESCHTEFKPVPPVPEAALSAPSVLIVDDDASTLQTFAHALGLEGYDVETASNGASALRVAAAGRFDVVLLDASMPLAGGLSALRRLRTMPSYRDTPVGIITGNHPLDEASLAEFRRLGAEVRYKPMWVDDLVAFVAVLVRTSRAKHVLQPWAAPRRRRSGKKDRSRADTRMKRRAAKTPNR